MITDFVRLVSMTHVLAAIDFSGASAAVIREAEYFAQALGANLTLLHVLQPNPDDFVGFEAGPPSVMVEHDNKFQSERAQLEQLAAAANSQGIKADARLIQGPTAETILHEADQFDSKLIILGSHGHGMLHQALVGSVSAEVVKQSKRPVLIIPAADR
jgi:nucleotide-binding universal stress UspA family protein